MARPSAQARPEAREMLPQGRSSTRGGQGRQAPRADRVPSAGRHKAVPGFPWVSLVLAGALGASLLAGVLLGRPHDLWRSGFSLWLLLCAIALVAFALDKWLALRRWRRVPEWALLALTATGGWMGAWAGRAWFDHKTIKPSFVLRFWLASAWATLLWSAVLAGLLRSG